MLDMTKLFLGLMLSAAVVSASPMLAYADNGGGNKESWHQGQKDHMMAQILNLSEDQVKQLKSVHEKQKTAMKSVFEQMKSNRETFNAEITKASPDMNKINDIETQIKALQSQMADNQLNFLLETKKILTPEQFAGYMALKKQRELMGHEGQDKFGRKDGEGHKHWGGKEEGEDRD